MVNEISFSEKCTKCGLCEKACPNKIIKIEDSGMTYFKDRIHLCIHCGHCMSICPASAVIVKPLLYDKDFCELPPNKESYEKDFYNMILTRRAIRNFEDKPVPDEMLKKIVDAISLAPPGFTPVKTEIIVVSDTTIIKKALPYMVEMYDYLYKAMKNPIIKFFIKRKEGKKRFKLMESHLMPMLEKRLPGLKDKTEDTITRNAPAMILFHANKDGEDIKNDALVAATYCMLAAHSMGLGGSIMDIFAPIIDKKKELKELFQVPDKHEVLTAVIIGFPKYQYQRGIVRNLKSIKWI